MKETGFNAMGKPVPPNRVQKGYILIKEILGCNNEQAWNIVNRCKILIEKDMAAYIIGVVSLEQGFRKELFGAKYKYADEMLASIDLTGRYRLLAEILTD